MPYELPEVEARAELISAVYKELEALKNVNKILDMHKHNAGHTIFHLTMEYFDPVNYEFKTIDVPMNPDLDTDIRANLVQRKKACEDSLVEYFNAEGGYTKAEEDEA